MKPIDRPPARFGAGRPQPSPVQAQRPAGSDDARLRRVATQLEGVFVEQLLKAMRETVPTGGLTDGGPGEEVFTSMLDQHLASQVPGSWERGLSAALYRQLQAAVSAAPVSADTTPNVGSSE